MNFTILEGDLELRNPTSDPPHGFPCGAQVVLGHQEPDASKADDWVNGVVVVGGHEG